MRKLLFILAGLVLCGTLSAQINEVITTEWNEDRMMGYYEPMTLPFDGMAPAVVESPVLQKHKRQIVIFGNVPKDIFPVSADSDKAVNGVFLWSLDAVVSGAEITYNKEASVFETKFLSGVGGAVGWKHYKPLPDGTPISDWGVNLALLTQVQINETVRTGMEVALLANLYNITAGPVYIFNDKKIGLLVGANVSF